MYYLFFPNKRLVVFLRISLDSLNSNLWSYLLVAPLTRKEYAICLQLKHPSVYISEPPRRNRIMVFSNYLAGEITGNVLSTMSNVSKRTVGFI